MRVLVVKPSSIGDLVHTFPALTDAVQAIPEIQFDWVCEPSLREVPHWHPHVHDVLAIPLWKWRRRWYRLVFSREFQAYKAALAAKRYDAVIDAQGSIQTAFLITRFTDGVRHGFAANSAPQRFASLAYEHKHAVLKDMHAITRTRQLFAKSLGYAIPTGAPEANLDFGRPIEMAKRLVLITQSSQSRLAWSEPDWRAVIEDALPLFADIVLLVGSHDDDEKFSRMAGDYPIRILRRVSPTDAACEIAGSQGVVALDNDLAQIADALGVPLLAVCGRVAYGRMGPVGPRSSVLQCFPGRMDGVGPKAVMGWVNDLDTTTSLLNH